MTIHYRSTIFLIMARSCGRAVFVTSPARGCQLLTRLGRTLALLLSLLIPPAMAADTGKSTDASKLELLNVSYDVSREFYKDFNAAFSRYWQSRHGQTVTLQQSHGGSSKQARAVIDGLAADVVTMNQQSDIDAIAAKGLIRADWRSQFPFGSAPYSSTIVFLVRNGNPKAIKDWDDLVKPGVGAIIPNPKTSGNGRYSYLAAWGYALRRGDSDAKARDFTAQLFRNVPILDAGGRAATTTFIQRGIGDVLLTFESEIQLIVREFNPDDFQVVYPSISIDADAPVAVVDKVVDEKGTRALAEAYLSYLFSEEGQRLAAQHYNRPRDPRIAAEFSRQFPVIKLFTVDELFGGWTNAQKVHFTDGGTFDQIYQPATR